MLISWRLVAKLHTHFSECSHVDHVTLSVPARDKEIWNYALLNDLIIVSNDEDFLNLANAKGFPPKVVLLRTGNQSSSFVETLLVKYKADIDELHRSADYGFLEIF